MLSWGQERDLRSPARIFGPEDAPQAGLPKVAYGSKGEGRPLSAMSALWRKAARNSSKLPISPSMSRVLTAAAMKFF